MQPTRVLIVTGAEIGARVAGPAIRAMAIARVLARDGHHVVLASTSHVDPAAEADGFRVTHVNPGDATSFADLERESDVVVMQGHGLEHFPRLANTDRVLVVDAYDPMHLEMLEQGRDQPRATWEMLVRSRVALLNQQLVRADLVLCASERQRALYIGQLAALGRVSPDTYESDPHLSRLIAVVPFGLDPTPAEQSRSGLRGVFAGIDDASKVVLWGGGIYSWFDPLVLVRAVHALAQRKPEVKLVFLGTKHPGVEPMGIVHESVELARSLGALESSVFFNEDWVPFEQRGNYLFDADAGVSTHHSHVETEFSFRTRILDYLWASLPMVVTQGDTFADLVEAEGLGLAVPAGDQDALERALERVLFDDSFAAEARGRVAVVREQFAWESVLQPLRDFVKSPRRAPDVEAAGGRDALAGAVIDLLEPLDKPGVRRDIRMALHYVRHGGVRVVLSKLKARRDRQ